MYSTTNFDKKVNKRKLLEEIYQECPDQKGKVKFSGNTITCSLRKEKINDIINKHEYVDFYVSSKPVMEFKMEAKPKSGFLASMSTAFEQLDTEIAEKLDEITKETAAAKAEIRAAVEGVKKDAQHQIDATLKKVNDFVSAFEGKNKGELERLAKEIAGTMSSVQAMVDTRLQGFEARQNNIDVKVNKIDEKMKTASKILSAN